MKTQSGDAGVSVMVVMMVVAIFWMFSGSHGGHGMMMPSEHDKAGVAMETMPSNQIKPADAEAVDNTVRPD